MDFPTGVSFYTGPAALARRKLEESQMAILARAGFEEIITPVLEYHRPGGAREEEERICKFPDQLSGRMLALRSDFTVQIAQFGALRLAGRGGVHRWCYRGNVFRQVKEHAGQKRQIYQVGAELLGDSSLSSTAGIVDLAVALIRASGLEDFALVIGHVGFVERIMRTLRLSPEQEPALREVLRRKDLTALEAMARELSLDDGAVEDVRRSMYLLGGEEVLAEAERLFEGDLAGGVMEELRGILDLTSEAGRHILFDLTEPRGFDYYTGVMFHVVVPRIGREVCRGGRYDNLLAGFGAPAPAVGFAVDLDLVLEAADGHERERSGDGRG